MSSTVMMERPTMGMSGVGVPGLTTPAVGTPTGVPATMMVPRCTYKVEKCQGGMKITATCDDKMAASMVQNLCQMLAGGLCSCYVMMNGMTCCCFNFTMGMCKCEMVESGVSITCTSGDPKCCEMIQACCDCLSCMIDSGCTCCVCFSGTPVCCGTCDPKSSPKKVSK